ncbi:MAG: 6-pyruvoyl trahydropterin synthase family protein [Neisseriaceae bacterium]
MAQISAIRKHEIHTGHRVYGHNGKCQYLHGHSYVIHFHCVANELDKLGMVIDFGIIKSTLCQWLEDNYDHHMLIWEKDPIAATLLSIDDHVTLVPFNPTAENIGNYLLTEIAPKLLKDTNVLVNKVVVEESSRCRAECDL